MVIVKKQDGVFSLLASLDGQSRIVDRRAYNIKVAANGNQLSLEIGGTEILTVQDDTFPNGSIGFNTYRLETAFDNVIVRNLTSPPPAPVPPVILPPLMDSTNQPHAVKTAGLNTYTYDANGNMATVGNRSFTFNHDNRLTKISDSGLITDFTYDADGGRVKKIVNGADTTIYISSNYVCETGSCKMYVMAHGQKIVSIDSNGVVNYTHQNHLNSTSVITDSSGASIKSIVYYPYGATLSDTGSANPRYEYTGKEKDNSTGLYFYGARYYDSTLGRFISADTLITDPLDPEALNRYSYARNNPILYMDPSGHGFFSFIGNIFKSIGNIIKGIFTGDPMAFVQVGIMIATWGVGSGVFAIVEEAIFTAFSGGLQFVLSSSQMLIQQTIAGIASGASAGLTSSLGYTAAGYDVDIGRAIAIGALGGLNRGIATANFPAPVNIAIRGLVAGGTTQLAGRNFGDGFGLSVIQSALHYSYKFIANKDERYKVDGAHPGSREPNVIGNAPGTASFCIEGSSCSQFLGKIPFISATAKFHDPLTTFLGGKNFITNYPTMIPSLALTIGASTYSIPPHYYYIFSTIQKDNEEEE